MEHDGALLHAAPEAEGPARVALRRSLERFWGGRAAEVGGGGAAAAASGTSGGAAVGDEHSPPGTSPTSPSSRTAWS